MSIVRYTSVARLSAKVAISVDLIVGNKPTCGSPRCLINRRVCRHSDQFARITHWCYIDATHISRDNFLYARPIIVAPKKKKKRNEDAIRTERRESERKRERRDIWAPSCPGGSRKLVHLIIRGPSQICNYKRALLLLFLPLLLSRSYLSTYSFTLDCWFATFSQLTLVSLTNLLVIIIQHFFKLENVKDFT